MSSYETYFDDYAYFKQLAAQYGASYYDFNLAKPELFENKEPDYHKGFHPMNAAGGHAFSLSMANAHAGRRKQDVESLFETPSEYLAAVNYITNVYLTPEVHPGQDFCCWPVPTTVRPYRLNTSSGSKRRGERIQPGFRVFYPLWTEYAAAGTAPTSSAAARIVGSSADFERYYECSVDFDFVDGVWKSIPEFLPCWSALTCLYTLYCFQPPMASEPAVFYTARLEGPCFSAFTVDDLARRLAAGKAGCRFRPRGERLRA